MADEIRKDAANAGREVAGGTREVAGKAEEGLGHLTGSAGMTEGGRELEQSGYQERTGVTPGSTPGAAPSSALPAHETLADAVEGLRQDAGPQGRTLEQAEEQGVFEAGHDGDAPTPGFFGDHRDIDASGNPEGNNEGSSGVSGSGSITNPSGTGGVPGPGGSR